MTPAQRARRHLIALTGYDNAARVAFREKITFHCDRPPGGSVRCERRAGLGAPAQVRAPPDSAARRGMQEHGADAPTRRALA